MDFTYSNLAFADAFHDYKSYFNVYDYKDIIVSGLPNRNILPFRNFVSDANFEDTILDIFTARRNDIIILSSLSPEEIHKTLCKDKTTFGLIGDANGSLGLVKELEKQSKQYYVIRNVENRIDASKPAYYGSNKNCIIVTDNITTLNYPKWNSNVCVSSKFCSNYDIQISCIDDSRVSYDINMESFVIKFDEYKTNPNSKSKTRHVIKSLNSSDVKKSAAFQRKRSGDWLQALSSADTDRLYRLPTGEVQKLNCPLYFCTEDRVAAAFSLALGLETIFHQRGSSVQYLYTPDRHTMNAIDFACSGDAYKESNMNIYKNALRYAINIYELHCVIVKQELDSEQHIDNNILRYIGYIYEYVFINDALLTLVRNMDFIKQFLEGNDIIVLESEKKIIQDAYSSAKMYIPELITHNVHVIPRFPCLDTVEPISQTGIVGASEIYIVALLSAMIRSDPVVLTAIEKCVQTILHKSTVSEQLQFHYGCLMDEVNTYRMSGGKAIIPNTVPIITKTQKCTTHMKDLAKTYLDYLRLYEDNLEKDAPFTLPLETMEIGRFSLCTNCDYTFVHDAMKKLIRTYRIGKKEFQHHIDSIPDD